MKKKSKNYIISIYKSLHEAGVFDTDKECMKDLR